VTHSDSHNTHGPAEAHPRRDADLLRDVYDEPRNTKNQRRAAVFLLYVLVASVVLTVFVVHPGFEGHPRATFADQVDGRAHRPFAGRILVPTVIRGMCAATPDAFERYVARRFAQGRFVRSLGWDADRMYEYFAVLALMAGCFVGTLYIWRELVERCYRYPAHVADVAPVIGLLSLTLFFRYLSYMYDPATILLFSASILALCARPRGIFVVVFTLAVLNKETSALLIPLYWIRYRAELAPRRLALHVGSLAILWLSIRALILYFVRQNPGRTLESHLIDHNLRLPWLYPLYFAYTILIFWVAVWLVRRGWHTKPAFFRTGLLVTFLPLFAASFFFGYVDELRGYYECFPFLFLLSVPSLCSIFGVTERGGTTSR
jgi:hypothetical protein